MQVESSATPLLTVDEVEKVQRQRVASLIGHVFQLTYAATVDKLIQEEKLNRCHGCAIQHPSQNQHSCLMMVMMTHGCITMMKWWNKLTSMLS